jgi:hypothetical protein
VTQDRQLFFLQLDPTKLLAHLDKRCCVIYCHSKFIWSTLLGYNLLYYLVDSFIVVSFQMCN